MGRNRFRPWAVGTALVLVSGMACAATSAVDGDTLDYDGAKLQLWGIEAPDKGQTCDDGWPAGKFAAEHLAKLVDGHKVECVLKTTDGATPVYAACKADGEDLSAAMVSAGFAWANLEQSHEYAVGETTAMIDVAGVHAHHCLKAQEWRARH